MVVTANIQLPSEEELTVPEVNLSASVLRAAANHVGLYCEKKNNEFMLCRAETMDPRACIQEGKEVTACSLEFFRLLKKNCKGEFHQHANCLDKSSGNYAFSHCRKTQGVYDMCVLEKMQLERPEYGYFCRARVHDTDRPAPPASRKTVYEDATPGLPPSTPKPPARFGARDYWTTE